MKTDVECFSEEYESKGDTIGKFLRSHDMTVYLVIFDRAAYTIGGKLFAGIAAYIDDGKAGRPNAAGRMCKIHLII